MHNSIHPQASLACACQNFLSSYNALLKQHGRHRKPRFFTVWNSCMLIAVSVAVTDHVKILTHTVESEWFSYIHTHVLLIQCMHQVHIRPLISHSVLHSFEAYYNNITKIYMLMFTNPILLHWKKTIELLFIGQTRKLDIFSNYISHDQVTFDI
jgi:hypothetical protein